MQTTTKIYRMVFCLLALMLAASSGFAASKDVTIDQVLNQLANADSIVNNFCSYVTFASYDANGKAIGGNKSGLRCYSKPDISVVCVTSSTGSREGHGEVGKTIRTEINGKVVTNTLPDSFFLHDIRSLIAIHKGEIAFAGKTGETHFAFEPSGQTTAAQSANGVYTISIEAKGYEKAVLRVDVKNGTVLEKTVFSVAAGKQVSRENHDDFVSAGHTLLPQQTVYEYGGQKIMVQLQNYLVNVPIDIRSFAAGEGTCEALASALGRNPQSAGSQAPKAK
jgi:hypothetical protein